LYFNDLHDGTKTELAVEILQWKFPKPEIIGSTQSMTVDDLIYSKPKKKWPLFDPSFALKLNKIPKKKNF